MWDNPSGAAGVCAAERHTAGVWRLLAKAAWMMAAWMAAFASGLGAQAQTLVFTPSNGVLVEVPEFGAHETCGDLSETLDAIDATRYRAGSPAAMRDPDDLQLLNYEERISQALFDRCEGGRVVRGDADYISFGG